ncbi:MAG: c-type cytochrome [Candidatus Eremiobacteraeota bacterium]|nr:c-type cytochrome [Candidatus Eremiobacteraeota bacterium]
MLKRTTAVSCLGLALAAVAFVPHGAHAASGPAFYTAAQAAAGKKLYVTNCAACHAADLSGTSAPPLRGPAAPYHGTQSVAEIYDYISAQMPLNSPGSLSPKSYASILAYLLQQNGHAAGASALTPAKAQTITANM